MNILITAATGTVGRSLAAALSDAGADVRATGIRLDLRQFDLGGVLALYGHPPCG